MIRQWKENVLTETRMLRSKFDVQSLMSFPGFFLRLSDMIDQIHVAFCLMLVSLLLKCDQTLMSEIWKREQWILRWDSTVPWTFLVKMKARANNGVEANNSDESDGKNVVSLMEKRTKPVHVHFSRISLEVEVCTRMCEVNSVSNIWILTLFLSCTRVCDCSLRRVRISICSHTSEMSQVEFCQRDVTGVVLSPWTRSVVVPLRVSWAGQVALRPESTVLLVLVGGSDSCLRGKRIWIRMASKLCFRLCSKSLALRYTVRTPKDKGHFPGRRRLRLKCVWQNTGVRGLRKNKCWIFGKHSVRIPLAHHQSCSENGLCSQT